MTTTEDKPETPETVSVTITADASKLTSAFERAMGGRPMQGTRAALERAEKHDWLTRALRHSAAGSADHTQEVRRSARQIVIHHPEPVAQPLPTPALFQAVEAAVKEAFHTLLEGLRNVSKTLDKALRAAEPPPPKEDKWARALWLRDHRNTGPPTPAAWRQRDQPRTVRARGPAVGHQRRVKGYPHDKARI